MGIFSKIQRWWKKEHKKPHCGIYGLNTGKDDPLKPACSNHDLAFIRKDAGIETRTLKQVNDDFLKDMKDIVANYSGVKKAYLTAKAYVFYGLVKVVTPFIWDK